ncbi:hypothetical protein LAZ67_2001439 [Cordylochernes scorpioides]|uniref:Histone-lysine N-methyltransferase SETMAR n=1 Tax=Cordylochernes scorpioides TaxID=51811 RepID=A0ABY6K2X3_9ARAC|nr:hypothetical protein LAZ67_2001439 [Cordylochernes scorpioides]
MNSDLYCDILVNRLKPGIRNKRRGKHGKGVLFLHDNARPHTSCKTVSTIIKLGFEVLEHPEYSPDLVPSDYFLFGLLKKELKGKRFDSDEDVQKVVQDFFHTLPKSAYKEGIYKLPERWSECIESQGTCRLSDEEEIEVGEVKYNDEECWKANCDRQADGSVMGQVMGAYMKLEKYDKKLDTALCRCGVVSVEGSDCTLEPGTGHYPDCCPQPSCPDK